jgi:dolichol-phosphate mannosyltransferase
MPDGSLTIIIPTLNEEENIGELCKKISEIIPKAQIIVVDDGSADNTGEIVKKLESTDSGYSNIKLLDRSDEVIHGLTVSIADGIRATKTENFMVIDGDFQHPPESLLDAIECFNQNADLVIGRRDAVEEWPFNRKLISWGAQSLAWFSLFIRQRQKPSDLMSGFFGSKTSLVTELIDHYDTLALKGYKFLFDILKVFPRDKKICEFGYIFKNREFGTSKIGKKHMWEFLKSIF